MVQRHPLPQKVSNKHFIFYFSFDIRVSDTWMICDVYTSIHNLHDDPGIALKFINLDDKSSVGFVKLITRFMWWLSNSTCKSYLPDSFFFCNSVLLMDYNVFLIFKKFFKIISRLLAQKLFLKGGGGGRKKIFSSEHIHSSNLSFPCLPSSWWIHSRQSDTMSIYTCSHNLSFTIQRLTKKTVPGPSTGQLSPLPSHKLSPSQRYREIRSGGLSHNTVKLKSDAWRYLFLLSYGPKPVHHLDLFKQLS